MVLGKLSVLGRPTDLDNQSRVRPTALAIGADGSCLDILYSRLSCLFFLSFILSLFFFSLPLPHPLRDGMIYCLKGPSNPKQLTNKVREEFGTFIKSENILSQVCEFTVKNIRRFYGKITGNQLPVPFPLFFYRRP